MKEQRAKLDQTMRIDITAQSKPRARAVPRVRTMPQTKPEVVGDGNFQELFQSVYDAAIITSANGMVVDANMRALEFFLCTRDEVVGRDVAEMIIGFDSSLFSTLNQNLEHNRFALIQAYCLRQDNTTFPAEISVSILHPGGAKYLCFFVRDITNRLLVENQREHARKLESIGQLAAGIAHEINTPIQYVGDNLRFLRESFSGVAALMEQYEKLFAALADDAVVRHATPALVEARAQADIDYLAREIPQALEQSLEGVERVSQIVQAMKEFSHPDTEEKNLTNINRAIESTVAVSRNEWKYVADMVLDLEPQLPPVPCMLGHFNQVVLNLIVNAAHAVADVVEDGAAGKGVITVSTRQDGDWVEMRISDTGAGIPEQHRVRMFEPFFTTKEVGKGTGQGLTTCHAIITKKHGGTINFETEIGKGTTFFVRLPLS